LAEDTLDVIRKGFAKVAGQLVAHTKAQCNPRHA